MWALNPGILIYLLYNLYVPLRVPKKAQGPILGAHTSNLRAVKADISLLGNILYMILGSLRWVKAKVYSLFKG